MEISVYDTFVKREDGKIMHFDILVSSKLKNESVIFSYGKQYLKSKSFKTDDLTSKECEFCHIEKASNIIEARIKENGYYIIEMEHCN